MLSARILKKLVNQILKGEGAGDGRRVDVTFVDEKEIRRLNRQYRNKDKATDVLSFAYDSEGILGDVLICKAVAKRNAGKFNNTFDQELKRLVTHGTLHVLGYDHGRKMSHAEKIYEKF